MLGGIDGRYSQSINRVNLQNQTKNSNAIKGSNKLKGKDQKTNGVANATLPNDKSNEIISRSTPKASMLKAGLQKLANKINNLFDSIFRPKPASRSSSKNAPSSVSSNSISPQNISVNKTPINKVKFLEEMNNGDVFHRDSQGGGIVNGTILFGNSRIRIPTVKVDLDDPNIKTIYDKNYNANVAKITGFLDQDADLKPCEKVLKTLMSQTITVINETSGLIQHENLTVKYIEKVMKNQNLKTDEPKNTLDYTFTIKKTEAEIIIEVRGTNKFELLIKEDDIPLPAEEQLAPVIVDVKFDIVIDKNKHIKKNSENIEEIIDFDIMYENVTQRLT